jgi:hypothetical protein
MTYARPHGNTAVRHGNAWLQTLKQPIPWIWDGVVAEDAVTLLSAPEKTGKTTLLSLLLDRRRAGRQVLGGGVRPGRTILCSEENDCLWALRQPPLDFGPQREYHRPIGGNPTPGRWRRFIDHLLGLAEDSFDLLVIDRVMRFLSAYVCSSDVRPAATSGPRAAWRRRRAAAGRLGGQVGTGNLGRQARVASRGRLSRGRG